MYSRISLNLLIGLTGLSCSTVFAESTFDTRRSQAWSGNAGWIDFVPDRPTRGKGVVFSDTYLAGYAHAPNFGWVFFGDGSPENHHRYSNLADDHGVNHDGLGNLSGYAWSANSGWINFGWAEPKDDNRPKVDLLTGDLSGYAYSGNLGWINLGTGILTTPTMQLVDEDRDGMSDSWEWIHFGRLSFARVNTDRDGDGESDLDEYLAGTDPNDPRSYLRIVSHTFFPSRGFASIRFTSTLERLYRLEYSGDLGKSSGWIDGAGGVFEPHGGAFTNATIDIPANSTNSFFVRVVAVRPLTAE